MRKTQFHCLSTNSHELPLEMARTLTRSDTIMATAGAISNRERHEG